MVKISLAFDGVNRTYTLEGDLAEVLAEDTKLRGDPRFKQQPRIHIEAGVAAPSGKRYYNIEADGATVLTVLDTANSLAGTKIPGLE